MKTYAFISGIFTIKIYESTDMFTKAGLLVIFISREWHNKAYFTYIWDLFVWIGATIRDASITGSQLPADPEINLGILLSTPE